MNMNFIITGTYREAIFLKRIDIKLSKEDKKIYRFYFGELFPVHFSVKPFSIETRDHFTG